MSEHTPGPWGYEGSWPNGDGYVNAGRLRICLMSAPHNKQNQADAHLIVSAPEMLEALEMIHADTESIHIREAARAAIARATGEVRK